MTLEELEQGKAASLAEIAAAADAEAVEKLRVKYVGRNGSIPALIKGMKDVPKEERPAFGKAVQAWRAEVEAALAAKGADRRVEQDLHAGALQMAAQRQRDETEGGLSAHECEAGALGGSGFVPYSRFEFFPQIIHENIIA
jgi:phenylalanyl-tRNA synthetase alpha subunit